MFVLLLLLDLDDEDEVVDDDDDEEDDRRRRRLLCRFFFDFFLLDEFVDEDLLFKITFRESPPPLLLVNCLLSIESAIDIVDFAISDDIVVVFSSCLSDISLLYINKVRLDYNI